MLIGGNASKVGRRKGPSDDDESASRKIGARSGPGENDAALVCFVRLFGALLSLLFVGLDGREDIRFDGFGGIRVASKGELSDIAAARTSASNPFSDPVWSCKMNRLDLHWQCHTLLHLQGFRSVSTGYQLLLMKYICYVQWQNLPRCRTSGSEPLIWEV